jgi:F0F1-type ATP synthase membrane subunit b/b'
MGEIARQLVQLFVQSIPTVIFVFFLLILLERLFFQPFTQLLKQREEVTRGALARAREQVVAAEAKAAEYDQSIQAARQEIFRRREAARREAQAERAKELSKARAASEAFLKDALASLATQSKAAREELAQASGALAAAVTEAVLGGGPSPRGPEGA